MSFRIVTVPSSWCRVDCFVLDGDKVLYPPLYRKPRISYKYSRTKAALIKQSYMPHGRAVSGK